MMLLCLAVRTLMLHALAIGARPIRRLLASNSEEKGGKGQLAAGVRARANGASPTEIVSNCSPVSA